MKYLATAKYASTVEGTPYRFDAGAVVDVRPEHITGLLRDGAPIDFLRPLSDAEAAEHVRRVEAEKHAAEQAEYERDMELRLAVAEHVQAWDGHRCPGRRGQAMPAGHVSVADVPHDATGVRGIEGTGLQARRVGEGDDSWWAVGCASHLQAIVASGAPPEPPPRVDRTVRRYRAARRYRSTFKDYDAEGSVFTVVPETQMPKALVFEEGEAYEVPAYIAAWANRDSPGVLVPTTAEETPS